MKNQKLPILFFLFVFIFNFSSTAQLSFVPLDTLSFSGGGTALNAANRIQYLDYTKDGNLDMVFRKEYAIILRQGNGDGTWLQDSILYSQKSTSIYGASNLYDINDDGFLDMAILSAYNLSILLGSAEGLVVDNTVFFQNYFDQLEWLDYNNDGKVDLLAETYEGIVVNYDWINNLGAFTSIINTPQPTVNFKFIDFNNDGNKDVALGTTENLIIYFSDNAGAFTEVYSTPTPYLFFQTGDINMDSYIDLVYEFENKLYSLVFDEVAGSFTKTLLPNHNNYFMQRNPTLIDIDNNLSLDIVFGSINGGIAYLLNSGGVFNTTKVIVQESYLSFNSRMYYLDVNNDQRNELIAHGSSERVVFYLDQQLQTIDSKIDVFAPNTNDIAVNDIDGDGFEDIIYLRDHGAFSVRYGTNIDTVFSDAQDYEIPSNTKRITVFDLNRDNNKDLLITRETDNNGINTVLVSYGDGNRGFSAVTDWKYIPDPSRPQISDINMDGLEEVLFFVKRSNELLWIDPLNTNYNEYFSASHKHTLQYGNGIRSMAIVDMDLDGSPDILTANTTSKNVSILINDGLGNFTEDSLDIGEEVYGVAGLDYNADQIMDIIIATSVNYSSKFKVYLGDGTGQYTFNMETPIDGFAPENIEVLDFENDGDLDIVIGEWDYSTIVIFENDNGVYIKKTDLVKSIGQSSVVYSDLNKDGKIDVVSANMNSGNEYIQLNNSVSEPNLGALSVAIQEIGYNYVDLVISNLQNTGVFIIAREGQSNTLFEKPIDNNYYTVNASYGSGATIDGGYVVYFNSDSTVRINDLNPLSEYTFFVFGYNQNTPAKSITNYSENHITVTVQTNSSLYSISGETISFNEDELYSVSLDTIINNYGGNVYTVTPLANLQVTISASDMELQGVENYYGQDTVSVAVSTPFESKVFKLPISILPVNDVPTIEQLKDSLVRDLVPVAMSFHVSDVETDSKNLIITYSSSDESVIPVDSVSINNDNGLITLRAAPKDYGKTTISIMVSDSAISAEMNFVLTVIKVLGLDEDNFAKILFYPNPVRKEITLDFISRGDALRVMDMSGKTYIELKKVPKKLDLSNLKPGVYVLQIGEFSTRLIKE